jgi:prophage regulatory protein
LRISSSSPHRLRIEQAGQYDLPFPVETEALSYAAKTDFKPEPPPVNAAGKIPDLRDSKTSRQHAARRNHRNRKPVAKETLPPSGSPLRRPEEAQVEVGFLRLPEVKAITGLSKSTLYALMQEKNFPMPIRLGPRAVAWVRSEVKQWAAERIHASRSAA